MRLEQPRAPLEEQVPRRPGAGAARVYCKCGNWIGERDGGWLFTVYRQREQTAPLPAAIRCEKCGRRTLVG